MNASIKFVQVPFRGDIIDAVKTETGEILVNPIRICDSLGLRWENQRVKLASCEWACTLSIRVQVQDGQSRQHRNVTMIPLKIVPMWLASISVNKVKQGIRAKLLAYQLEVVEVLAAWFLGVSDIPGLADEMRKVKERLSAIEAELDGTQAELGVTQTTLEIVQRRFDSLVGNGVCTEFLTLREFVETYKIKGILGSRFKGSQLRVISRHLNKLSQVIKADVRKVSHPAFGSVNAYRFDVLQGWLAVSNISNATTPEDFGKLVQGRLFI